MRIRDWSSDVCSSDLAGRGLVDKAAVAIARLEDRRRHRFAVLDDVGRVAIAALVDESIVVGAGLAYRRQIVVAALRHIGFADLAGLVDRTVVEDSDLGDFRDLAARPALIDGARVAEAVVGQRPSRIALDPRCPFAVPSTDKR